MKREDLNKIEGLSKEQIESIMNLHKVDAEQYKKDLEEKDAEINTKDTKITDLTEKVKGFDGVDVEKLKSDVEGWKKKYSEDLATEKKNAAIKLAIAATKPKNEKALMALLDTEIVKINDDGSVTGLKEQLENIKKDNAFLFEEETKTPEDVNLGGQHIETTPKEVTWETALEEHYGEK